MQHMNMTTADDDDDDAAKACQPRVIGPADFYPFHRWEEFLRGEADKITSD